MICDVSSCECSRLKTRASGRWGLNLCTACYNHLLSRKLAARPAPAELLESARAAGAPPFEWPLCEYCGEDVNQLDLGYYTLARTQRRFCSVRCHNIHNGLVSADVAAAKLRERVREGLWTDPHDFTTPEERRRYGRLGASVRAADPGPDGAGCPAISIRASRYP